MTGDAMKWQTERIWLCCPAVILFCSDVTITLSSQRAAFWEGAFHTVEEANPLARVLLLFGPWTFLSAAVCWVSVCILAMLYGNRGLARALSYGLTIGHALGTASWLPRHGRVGFLAAILLIVAAKQIMDWCWAKSDVEFQNNGLQELVRKREPPVQIL